MPAPECAWRRISGRAPRSPCRPRAATRPPRPRRVSPSSAKPSAASAPRTFDLLVDRLAKLVGVDLGLFRHRRDSSVALRLVDNLYRGRAQVVACRCRAGPGRRRPSSRRRCRRPSRRRGSCRCSASGTVSPPATATGTLLTGLVKPLPSSPQILSPQQNARAARRESAGVEPARADRRERHAAGDRDGERVACVSPVPSWPWSLLPQQKAAPAVVTPHACW